MSSSQKGRLLVAAPSLLDPNFRRAVVLVCQHDAEGAVGLIVNRPSDVKVGEALSAIEGAGARSETIWQGGPVQRDSVLILHGGVESGGEEIAPGIWFGADLGLLTALFAGPTPDVPFRLYAGYAGWGAGQLDEELKQGAWFLAPAAADRVFSDRAQDCWSGVLRGMGGRFSLLALTPEAPELN